MNDRNHLFEKLLKKLDFDDGDGRDENDDDVNNEHNDDDNIDVFKVVDLLGVSLPISPQDLRAVQ